MMGGGVMDGKVGFDFVGLGGTGVWSADWVVGLKAYRCEWG